LNNKEAHVFEINDALLYFPSSNLNYQGDVNFRTPNPKPSAKFEYYVKTGHETLKEKRKKAQKAAEKSGKFSYPTEEELLAESEESKPTLVFTIYDASGNIMRKLSAPLKSGYNSISWDLSYLTNRGAKVPTGDYKLAIDKNIDGKFTRIIEGKSFKVISIPNALGTPNYTSNFNFQKNVIGLNGKVTSARGKIKDMNTRVENMKKILANTPVEASVLVDKMDALQKEIDKVTKVIIGGFGAKNTVLSRIRFALYTTSSAQVDITGAQKEQFKLAEDAFKNEEGALNSLFNVKLPALEKEFEQEGGILFNNPPTRRNYEE